MGSTSRRWFLQAGLTGFAGLSMAQILQLQAEAASRADAPPSRIADRKSVILFWLSGGPSHIDMWDPSPTRPRRSAGRIGTIATRVPGVRFCEHLPLQAAIMDKLTVIRSVDCSASNHTPITMQAGNALARRTDDGKDGGGLSVDGLDRRPVPRAERPSLPAFVGLADSWKADVWGAGAHGQPPTSRSRATSWRAGCACPRRQPRSLAATAMRCGSSSTGCAATRSMAARWSRSTATPGRPSRW